MGILDDAIREHLELKRRRGADPEEIQRLEREALGPVRRIQEGGEVAYEPGQPATAFAEDHLEDFEEPIGVAEEPEEASPTEPWAYDVEEEEALLPGESWAADEPAASPVADGDYLEPEPELLQEIEAEPATGPAPVPPSPAVESPAPEPEPSGETVEYDVEAAQEDEPEGEELLEETPEFLQDTPDHDRLWFEQRPPRDFDFDG